MTLTDSLKEAYERSLRSESRLSEEVLAVPGMSGLKVKHLLNNLGARCACYLEIGSLHGASLTAACFNNSIHAFAVENFSEANGTEEQLRATVRRFAPNTTLLLRDAFEPETAGLVPERSIDLFFYDGQHSESSHECVLPQYITRMRDKFIFICDDWNWAHVRTSTLRSAERCSLIATCCIEVTTAHPDPSGYWNGLGLFVFEKE